MHPRNRVFVVSTARYRLGFSAVLGTLTNGGAS